MGGHVARDCPAAPKCAVYAARGVPAFHKIRGPAAGRYLPLPILDRRRGTVQPSEWEDWDRLQLGTGKGLRVGEGH